MALDTVGRDDEVAALHAFLERAGGGPSALVLEGEAGIGKTTLWLAAVEAARERSLRVLTSRPAEAERELAYVGLADLLERDLDDVLSELPTPRRRALESALLLDGDEGAGTEPRTLGAAVLTTLRLLAARGPLLVAVDDVQWLDAPSAAALAFALRRLEAERVATLLARRATAPQPRLEAALPDARRLLVGPLTLGALQGVLRTRLGRTLPRPTLVRVHEVSGGNPFYALELGRSVLAAGVSLDPAAPFPFPDSLQELVGGRLGRLPEETRRALLVVAALGSPTRGEVEAAGVDAEALEPAVAAGVLEDGSPLRFAHPLLASELEAGAPADDRRAVHRRLAGVVADSVGRARHLAQALEGPDPAAAADLEDAAAAARARGAPSVAAELCEAAARATPPEDPGDGHRRAVRAARDHLAAGAAERAFVVAREALELAPAGRRRAEALLVLGELDDIATGDQIAARAHLRAALAEVAASPDLALLVHERLALNTRITEGLEAAERHARAAVRLAEELHDDRLTSRALGALATVRCNAGGDDTLELAGRALELATASGDRAALDEARISYGHCHAWTYRLDEARRVLLDVVASAAERDEPMLSNALWYLATVEERAGNLGAAREYAERSHDLAVQYGGPDRRDEPTNLGARARIAGFRGEEAEARALIARGIAFADATAPLSTLRYLRQFLAVLDHWAGDNERAAELFAQVDDERLAVGFSYRMAPYTVDYVETLLELGRHEDAAAHVDDWEAGLAAMGQDWGLAEVLRSRGLLAAARGELEEAEALLERAVVEHEAVGDPFGRGRALLALGRTRRRLRRKRPAREAIEAAVRAFEEMGAAGWAEKARAELGRVGGRTRIEGLSPAELRVAALVAEGRTNKEVAAALFLGERTVETHLTRIYSKLGVRSRSQLARTLR